MQQLQIQKVVIVGNSGVGKTSLVTRYIDKEFKINQFLTISAEFNTKIHEYEGKKVKMQIWDSISGRERFISTSRSFFRSASGVLLCFDLTDEYSFETTKNWLEDVKNSSPEDVSVILIGTKCDLVNKRKVDEEKIRIFALENGLKYFETSSKTGENVDEIINNFFDHLIVKNREKIYDNEKFIPIVETTE